MKNIFSVCAHIQDPALYTPQWADNAHFLQQQQLLVASSELATGDIVSLIPIDALGLSTTSIMPNKNDKKGNRNKKRQKKSKPAKKKEDFLVFDEDRDGAYFGVGATNSQIRMQLDYMYKEQARQCELLTDISPNNHDNDDPTPSWMGHLATLRKQDDQNAAAPNCVIVPLPGGATPLCALVAMAKIDKGAQLVVTSAPIDNPQFLELVASKYRLEIQELRSYLAMAFQSSPLLDMPPIVYPSSSATSDNSSDDAQQPTDANTNFQSPFHAIDKDYPGLRYLHRDPDVLAIDNFLTDEECDHITQQSASHLYPCVIKHPVTGEVYEDPSRTSTNANLPQSDVPSIVEKLVRLTRCIDASHLETLQILKYTKGQTFFPHTDGFQGPTTACGYENSGRLVTIFCYLNDVPNGGETRFNQLLPEQPGTGAANTSNNQPLSIAPRKGMAVLHFPTTTGFEEDPRTEHEGCTAIDDKWLLVTWMWSVPRTDPLYAEINFPSIMGGGVQQ